MARSNRDRLRRGADPQTPPFTTGSATSQRESTATGLTLSSVGAGLVARAGIAGDALERAALGDDVAGAS